MISTILWYLFVIVVTLCWAIYAIGGIILLFINDFPNRRKRCPKDVKLTGKTTLITGSNRGIGYETAKDFAIRGARVVMACRNVQTAEEAKSKIIADTGNENVIVMHCDLSDLESVQNFCKKFLAKETALHILVNNGGIGHDCGGELTKQKFEMAVGTNYVGHFLLTYLLQDVLKASAPSRVVNVSSAGNYSCRRVGLRAVGENGVKCPDWNNYDTSKLLLIMHARELAMRLEEDNVSAYSLHPGFIFDAAYENQYRDWNIYFYYCTKAYKLISISLEDGAQTTIYCATEPNIESSSGKYFDNCKVNEPNRLALNNELCEKVWDLTSDAVKDYTKVAVE